MDKKTPPAAASQSSQAAPKKAIRSPKKAVSSPLAQEILQSGSPILHQKAAEVPVNEITSPRIQDAIRKMIATLESQADGVGLAAPQIGIPLRIFMVAGFVFDRIKKSVGNPHEIFINPVITKESKEKKWLDGEGCLSVRWLYGKVHRSTRVTLQAYDHRGELRTRGSSGLLAHIFQHEVDHLEGVLFTDKAKDLQEFDPEEIKAETAKSKDGHFNTPRYDMTIDAPGDGGIDESDFNPEL